MSQPLVAIVMGSDSDLPVMHETSAVLEELHISFEVSIASAHRTPEEVQQLAANAASRGIWVIIACRRCCPSSGNNCSPYHPAGNWCAHFGASS